MPVKEFDSIDSAEMAFKEPYCIVGVFSLILHCSYICLDKRQKIEVAWTFCNGLRISKINADELVI